MPSLDQLRKVIKLPKELETRFVASKKNCDKVERTVSGNSEGERYQIEFDELQKLLTKLK